MAPMPPIAVIRTSACPFLGGLIQDTSLPAGEKGSKAGHSIATGFAGDQSSSPSSPGCARGSARSRLDATEPVMAGSPGRRTP